MEEGPGIQDFLVECTVRVQTDRGGGTGFFIAPGLVATCAHLIEDDRNGDYPLTDVNLLWSGQRHRARIVRYAASPDPNIAILETGFTQHPSAYLFGSQRPDDALYLCGYSSDTKITRLVVEGVEKVSPSNVTLQAGPTDSSLSGAPLLNLRTGGVCAILNTGSLLAVPGPVRAIPVSKLEDLFPDVQALHDRHHEETPRWFDCTGIVGTAFAARSHVAAMRAASEGLMHNLLGPKRRVSVMSLHSPAKFRVLAAKPDAGMTVEIGTDDLLARCFQWGRSLLLVGQAGSGRSSLLRLFAHEAAASCTNLGARNQNCLFPILLRANQLASLEGSPEELVLNAMRTSGGPLSQTTLPTEFLTDLSELPRLRLLIMLDGVDEIQNARDLADLVGLIGRLREGTGVGSKTQLLLTSRPSSVEHFRYSDLDIYEILPLEQDSIEQTARRWLGERAQDFRDRNPALFHSGLLSSPLVLSVALTLFERHGKTLSKQVIALYGGLVSESIAEWKAEKLHDVYGSEILDHAVDVLGFLALELLRSANQTDDAWVGQKVEQYFVGRGFGIDEARDSAERFAAFAESNSLFLRKSGERYFWSHRSFRDYLAASYLVDSGPDAETAIREVMTRWFDANWGKSPSFAIQLLASDQDRIQIVEDILASERDSRLEFVAGLVRDGADLPDQILEKLIDALRVKAKEEQSAYGVRPMPPNGKVFSFDLLLSLDHLSAGRNALTEIASEKFPNARMREIANQQLSRSQISVDGQR